jgi:hypothetical protein
MSFERFTAIVCMVSAVIVCSAAASFVLGAEQQTMAIDTGGQVETRIIREVGPGGPAMPGAELPPMTAGTGVIVGQAIEAESSRPVPGALVTLRARGVQPLRVLADGQGRFSFRDLPAGNVGIDVSKPGYADGAYGRMRPDGPAQALTLEDGERIVTVSVPLWKFGVITGTVVDEAGEPVIGATVHALRRTFSTGRPTLVAGATDRTDDRGIYRVAMLTPGDYVVALQPSAPAGAPMVLSGANTAIYRAAFETAGQPVPLAAGAPVMVTRGADGLMVLGESTAAGPTYGTVFHPSSPTASRAALVRIAAGEERGGVDFQLHPKKTSRVSGTVTEPEGLVWAGLVSLTPRDADEIISSLETIVAPVSNGVFTFPAVPEGQYLLQLAPANTDTMSFRMVDPGAIQIERTIIAQPGGAPPPPPPPQSPAVFERWAALPIDVSGEEAVTGIDLVLRPAFKVSGSVEWVGGAVPPQAGTLNQIVITLEPADARTQHAGRRVVGRVDRNGNFTAAGAVPGRYFVRATGLPQGWYFLGAVSGGADVSDAPLEVGSDDIGGIVLTFTDRQTELRGTVTGFNDAPDPLAAVIAFPSARAAWSPGSTRRLRQVRTDPTGSYALIGLPPGQYFVAAVRDASASEWQDPVFLETLAAHATLIDLAEGQKVTRPLRAVR